MSQQDDRRAVGMKLSHRGNPTRVRCGAAFVVVALLASATSAWAEPAGVVATLEGTVEIGRGGTWEPASVGAAIEVGDQVRTGQPGRVRMVFRDESVLSLADDSLVVIDESVFDPAGAASARSLIRLLKGKLRAIVSETYQEPRASFEAETPTAVSGVRGTDFIISYDPDSRLTQIVGISGAVEVHSTSDRRTGGVLVGPREITEVAAGRLPTAPRHLDDEQFLEYVTPLEFIGLGLPEGASFEHPLVEGSMVLTEDRVEARGDEAPRGEALPALGQAASGAAAPPYEVRGVPEVVDQPPAAAGGDGDIGIRF